MLIAHRLEEVTDLKKKTCSASLIYSLAIFLCTRCCSGRKTPDDLYGNGIEFIDVLHFSSPFTNSGTRLCQDTPWAHPPFLDILMNHLRETYLGKQSKIKLSWGLCTQPIGDWLCSMFITFCPRWPACHIALPMKKADLRRICLWAWFTGQPNNL